MFGGPTSTYVKEPSSETLLRLVELVLTFNCFLFGGNYYKQTNGVAMGTKMGPSYANLFVGFIERLYGRSIDDCIGATSSGYQRGVHSIYNHRQFLSSGS